MCVSLSVCHCQCVFVLFFIFNNPREQPHQNKRLSNFVSTSGKRGTKPMVKRQYISITLQMANEGKLLSKQEVAL